MAERGARVIAISGITGSGKTTLANRLARQLPSACVFRFEHYQAAANEAQGASFVLHDHEAWNQVNYDPNQILPRPPGLEDFHKLIGGKPVHPPGVKDPIQPAEVVILEDSFSRDLHVLTDVIDVAIHLSLPLDVGLCRALLRFERNGKDPSFWIHNYMEYSLHYFYARLERVKDSADLVIDAMQEEEQVLADALSYLSSRIHQRDLH